MAGLLSCRRWPAWALLAGMLLLAGPALGQTPIQITKLRDLDFGGCDNVGGATYTVAPSAAQGPAACFGAQAAQFTVVGDPNRRVRIRVNPQNVSISNGSEALSAQTSASHGPGPTCLGGGTLTVYVGGSVTLPGGGLTTFGLFIGPTQIEASYIGGSC